MKSRNQEIHRRGRGGRGEERRSGKKERTTKIMRERLNGLSESIIGAAIAVHRELGPGLLESTYESCLEYELRDRGFGIDRQRALPVRYRGVLVDCGYRIDLLVNNLTRLRLRPTRLVIMDDDHSERPAHGEGIPLRATA